MLEINRDFVHEWAAKYDSDDSKTSVKDRAIEKDLKDWLSRLRPPKYLDWDHFLVLSGWKSPRPVKHYKANDPEVVEEITRLAFIAKHDLTKLNVLRALKGVNIRVASTILYFLHPDKFAIFDVSACRTLLRQICGILKRKASILGSRDGYQPKGIGKATSLRRAR